MFEAAPHKISDEIIENGYFITRGRPQEGMRLVWFPKNTDQLELYDANYKIVDSNAANDALIASTEWISHNAALEAKHYDGTSWVSSGGDKIVTPS